MTRLQKALDAACDSPPTTVADGRLILERLAAESRALAAALATAAERAASRWASALAAQCRGLPATISRAWPRGRRRRPRRRRRRTSPGSPRSRRSANWRRSTASGAGPARARIAAINRLAAQAIDLAEMEWSFLFDRTRQLLSIGYNVAERRRDASYYDLLASEARLCTFVAIAQGHLPQESWFALGPPADDRGGRAGAAVVERLDVRVPDAARRDAGLRRHAARPDVQGGGQAPDRVRPAPRRAVGHFRVGVQPARRAAHLPVPRVRRARPRPQARPRRRPGRRALRVGPGADGVARGGVREPAAARGRGLRGGARLLRGDRLHADAPAARPRARRRPLLHGASPGDDVPVAGAGAARRPDAGALRVRPGVPGDRAAAPGADPARERVLPARHPRVGGAARRRPAPTSPCARSAGPTRPLPRCSCCRTAGITSSSPTRAAGTADGRTSPSPAGARTRRRDNWGTFCYLRDVANGAFWSTTHQPTLQPADRFEAVFSEARAEFRSRTHQIESYTEIAVSPEDDVELRRLRLTNCGRTRRTIEVTSYAEVALAAPGRRRAAPGVQQPLRPDRDRPGPARHPLHEAPALARRVVSLDVPSHGGARRVRRRAPSRTRPIGCASSAAAGRPPTRARCASPGRSRAARGRCSIRSSRSAAGSCSSRTSRSRSTSSRAWPRRARRAWAWWASTRTGGSPIACSRWPPRTPRSSCGS